MSTTEQKQQTPTPAEIPFTTPQVMSHYVTDTGKILPRKYTHLSAKHQRAVTKTINPCDRIFHASLDQNVHHNNIKKTDSGQMMNSDVKTKYERFSENAHIEASCKTTPSPIAAGAGHQRGCTTSWRLVAAESSVLIPSHLRIVFAVTEGNARACAARKHKSLGGPTLT